jgi:hypothetical protein
MYFFLKTITCNVYPHHIKMWMIYIVILLMCKTICCIFFWYEFCSSVLILSLNYLFFDGFPVDLVSRCSHSLAQKWHYIYDPFLPKINDALHITSNILQRSNFPFHNNNCLIMLCSTTLKLTIILLRFTLNDGSF